MTEDKIILKASNIAGSINRLVVKRLSERYWMIWLTNGKGKNCSIMLEGSDIKELKLFLK